MKVGEDNFVVLQARHKKKVKNLEELVALGLIFGFCQDGESKFQGTISYIQEWLMCSRPTAMKTLKSLEEKGLIIKEHELVNGVLFNRYRVNLEGSKEILPLVKNFDGGSKESLPNNIDNNIYSTSTIPPYNNLFDTNNISEDEKTICDWLKQDIDIRVLQFKRAGLIENVDGFNEVLQEQVAKFYEQCRLDGKANINQRGRLDVVAHFNNWLNAVTRKKEDGADKKNNKPSGFDEQSIADMLRLD